MRPAVALLDREARSLVQRLRVWTPSRWAAAARPGLTRGDVAHHLAAVLAEAAGAPVALPRLDVDLVLPDQLAVTAADLVAAGPPDDVARALTAHLLLHRTELLADEVPPGLAADLAQELAQVHCALP